MVSSFIISLALQGFWWRKPKLNYMLELLKEFVNECKNNPIEMLADIFAVTTIFAFGYALLMLGSILGLN